MAHNGQRAGSDGCYLGVDWNYTSSATQLKIAPTVWRWDAQNTSNSGSSFSLSLSPDPSGAGHWSGYSWGSGYGWRQVEYFNTRTYTRTHSSQTITLNVSTDSSFGTYYGSSFVTIGALSRTWTLTVDPLASYSVTYNNNGGGTTPSAQTKWYGEELALRGAITNRTNYVFKNWNTKADGTGTAYAASAKYTGNAALTLYAQWYAPYTITPNANGGTLKSGCSALTKVHNTAKAIWTSSLNPTRTGHTFTGWNTKADGTGTSYAAGANYTANANSTLYAQWRINTWAVTYDGNGATGGSTAAQTKTYGQTLTLQSNGFTKTNHNFVKWNTAANGSGTSYNAGASYTGNAALKLYAQWEIAHGSPTISALTVKRCTSDGTESVEGDRMKVEAQWSVDNTTEGFEDTVGATFKVTLGNTTDTVNLSGTSGTVSFVHSATAAIGTSYKVTSVLADSKGFETTRTSTLSVAYFTMHFKAGGTGVGIGKPSTEDNLLDVGVETRFNALATAQGTTSSSVAYGSTNPRFRFSNANASQNGELVFTDYDAVHPGATLAWVTNQAQSWFHTQYVSAEKLQPPKITSGISYITGNQGTAALYLSKNTGSIWYPAICLDTASGGSWAIGNFDDENLKFSWASKENRDSGTNTVNVVNLRNIAGTIAIVPTQLYNNATGTTGTVTLSATAADYNHMRIYMQTTDGDNQVSAVDVYSPNGKVVNLLTSNPVTDGVWINCAHVTVSAKSITRKSNRNVHAGANTNNATQNVKIVRVEGWNE